jgi:hypothetical protein
VPRIHPLSFRVRLLEQLDGQWAVAKCAHDGCAVERVGAEEPWPPHRT